VREIRWRRCNACRRAPAATATLLQDLPCAVDSIGYFGAARIVMKRSAMERPWRRTLRRWRYNLFAAGRGIGRPQDAATWDDEFRTGVLKGLDAPRQLAH
jgi:hypothetical protein